MNAERLLELFDEEFRPRGRHTPAECLLALACDTRDGLPRRKIATYARTWRVSWETAQRVVAAFDRERTESKSSVDAGACDVPQKPTQSGLPGIDQRRSPILNLLPAKDAAGQPIGMDERAAWWDYEGSSVVADAEAESAAKGVSTPAGKSALLRSTAIRYFKRYLAGERRFRGVKERQKLEDAAEAYFSKPLPRLDRPPEDRPSRRLRHVEA